jgi:signal peptidase I
VITHGFCQLTRNHERGGIYGVSTEGIKLIHSLDGRPQIYLKRLVGLPGDELQIIDQKLWINGKPQIEFFDSGIKSYPPTGLKSETDLSQVYVVPENHAYFLGDNGANSSDSRIWGPAPLANIQQRYLGHLRRVPVPAEGSPRPPFRP